MMNFIDIPWGALTIAFAVSLGLSGVLTPLVLQYAKRKQLLDHPDHRRVHKSPIPRLGGVAIFLAILATLWIYFPGDARLLGLELGLVIIFVTGLLDDLYNLPPLAKLSGQSLAAATAIFFGITVSTLTNVFGGDPISLAPGLDVFLTLVWILVVVNTVNLLDGIDGLAAGISGITGIALALLSLTIVVAQPDTAVMAAILAGASAGFLIWNWHPAKIFMGDSGSHVLGFGIATLAIISGGKMATAALVLVLPLIDVVWAFARRAYRHQPLFAADKEHLHHQLLAGGLTQRQTVALLYLATIAVGATALVSKTVGKLVTMLMVAVLVAAIIALVAYFRRRR